MQQLGNEHRPDRRRLAEQETPPPAQRGRWPVLVSLWVDPCRLAWLYQHPWDRVRSTEQPGWIAVWERGQVRFASAIGIRIHGGVARDYPPYSFRIFFRGDYGEAGLPAGLLAPDLEGPIPRIYLDESLDFDRDRAASSSRPRSPTRSSVGSGSSSIISYASSCISSQHEGCRRAGDVAGLGRAESELRARDLRGQAALSSQSGGIGMAIIGFSRSAKMGVSAIVGLGNKSDIDEDDLLLFFEQDPNTQVIAQHCEDLKDGRAYAEVVKRVSKKKPVIMLKAGRTSAGAAAAGSHTGALAGNDKIYDDVLRQSGVIRAKALRELLEYARAIPVLPTPKGENVIIITGAGGSGVLLSDACVDNGLALMTMPPDLDQAFRKFIPPFGAAGNPVDITGGEPPKTYQNTIRLGLEDERIHSLILGYWHTIVTPPMVFAKNMVEVKKEMEAKGFVKPMVASLAGDIEVEEAAEYLYQNGIPA